MLSPVSSGLVLRTLVVLSSVRLHLCASYDLMARQFPAASILTHRSTGRTDVPDAKGAQGAAGGTSYCGPPAQRPRAFASCQTRRPCPGLTRGRRFRLPLCPGLADHTPGSLTQGPSSGTALPEAATHGVRRHQQHQQAMGVSTLSSGALSAHTLALPPAPCPVRCQRLLPASSRAPACPEPSAFPGAAAPAAAAPAAARIVLQTFCLHKSLPGARLSFPAHCPAQGSLPGVLSGASSLPRRLVQAKAHAAQNALSQGWLTPPDKPSLPDSGNGGSPCPQ